MKSLASQKIPTLEIKNISKRFSGTQALDSVSLVLYPGEVHALLGVTAFRTINFRATQQAVGKSAQRARSTAKEVAGVD